MLKGGLLWITKNSHFTFITLKLFQKQTTKNKYYNKRSLCCSIYLGNYKGFGLWAKLWTNTNMWTHIINHTSQYHMLLNRRERSVNHMDHYCWGTEFLIPQWPPCMGWRQWGRKGKLGPSRSTASKRQLLLKRKRLSLGVAPIYYSLLLFLLFKIISSNF